ncbi:hypothetical protein TNCT_634051 [Trichonephila clavata]|uniref:Uncharacterized protein n=1 Tax=Trichonephila clavata TaxID=2740835 RepID=A0A8X6FKY1_TRICU|nr:hypothetical protein TNCT_634051 [Trichonephila clavata]
MTSVYFPLCLLVIFTMASLLCKAESKSASQSNFKPSTAFDVCKSKADAEGLTLKKARNVRFHSCQVKCKFSGETLVLNLPKGIPCDDYSLKYTGVCNEDGECRLPIE